MAQQSVYKKGTEKEQLHFANQVKLFHKDNPQYSIDKFGNIINVKSRKKKITTGHVRQVDEISVTLNRRLTQI